MFLFSGAVFTFVHFPCCAVSLCCSFFLGVLFSPFSAFVFGFVLLAVSPLCFVLDLPFCLCDFSSELLLPFRFLGVRPYLLSLKRGERHRVEKSTPSQKERSKRREQYSKKRSKTRAAHQKKNQKTKNYTRKNHKRETRTQRKHQHKDQKEKTAHLRKDQKGESSTPKGRRARMYKRERESSTPAKNRKDGKKRHTRSKR